MPRMTWTPEMSVSVKVLDDDHKRLIEMVNELHDGILADRTAEVLMSILERTRVFTQNHLAREEQMLSQAGYPALLEHRQAHNEIARQALALRERCKRDPEGELSPDLTVRLMESLIRHTMDSDKKYGPFLNAKGIH